MASRFYKRTAAQGRVLFLQRIKYTLGIMHWAQGESRCSCTASLTEITDADEYKALLGTVLDQSALRKVEANQDDTISKAEYPGKFKDKRTWTEWEVKFENYLPTIPGSNAVLLSYIIRSQAAPDRTNYLQDNFTAKTIACATLNVAHFQADTRKVHQLLNNYLVAETAEQWISSTKKRVNGQDNFDALCCHYSGEGNVSRCVKKADRLQ